VDVARKLRCGRWKEEMRGGWLYDGVVVGPGGFETVGELFYWLHAGAIPDEESYECCCQAADHPN